MCEKKKRLKPKHNDVDTLQDDNRKKRAVIQKFRPISWVQGDIHAIYLETQMNFLLAQFLCDDYSLTLCCVLAFFFIIWSIIVQIGH